MPRWEEDLADLMQRRGPALVGYARALCGETGRAEDLVQDALVKVFSRLRSLPASTEVPLVPDGEHVPQVREAYVRRAILSLYLDEYRHRSRWAKVRGLVATADESRGPESGATARVDVGAALARLSPRQRACAVLRFYDDLTVPQIADRLGLAPGTVTGYLAEATQTLRAALAPPGTGPTDIATTPKGAVR